MLITNEDLYKNQFNYEILKTNIYAVSLIDILKTQVLTAEFCVKYILNSDFQLTDEEQLLTIKDVKKYQPHITNDELNNLFKQKKLLRKMDSFEDFESFLNRP
jgi:hypothetical protein